MRLRNLFMILLLCMTVGIFSACTGDDGATGPQGPQGDPGPQGEPGDGSGVEYTYSFLKTWGSETGAVTCSDPLLTGEGVFPGPAVLDPMPDEDNNGTPDIAVFEAQCGDVLFETLTSVKVGAATLTATAGAPFNVAGELVFVKTGQAIEGPSAPVEVASTETVRAKSVVTTKRFAGGLVFADMNTRGGNVEAHQRIDLHSNCGVGTDPSAIAGEWRAVRITEDAQSFDVEKNPVAATSGGVIRSITTKVCLRLDSIPGTVKCFVETETQASNAAGPPVEFAAATMVNQQIALYDGSAEEGMMLTGVAPMPHRTTKLLPLTVEANDNTDGTDLSTAANTNLAQNFFGTVATDQLTALDTSKLCNLFAEGLEASP